MNQISNDVLANLHLRMRYEDATAVHNQLHYAPRVNFWRDIFPPKIHEALMGKTPRESVSFELDAGEAVAAYDPSQRLKIRNDQFDPKGPGGDSIDPRQGRFYPKGLLRNIAGIYPQNMQPFRLLEKDDGCMNVELNHPMAGRRMQFSAVVDSITPKIDERGGTCVDWLEVLATGPGMQSRANGTPTDFFYTDAFQKPDDRPDEEFYRSPRFVHHIDRRAVETVSRLYGDLIPPGSKVLDLMSSWTSHLPEHLELASVTGLGLNQAELDANSRLTRRLVHNLNATPGLPLASAAFDAVICTVSVEYMTRPFDVFDEVARVLRKGGLFVLTFSNRWFPPKVVRVWSELHEFERMGLVLEYFLRSGSYRSLETMAVRGYPRPVDDKYFHQIRFSDPVYAVWGRKAE